MCADGKDVLQRMVEVPLCAGVLVLATARYPSPGALSFYSRKLAQHNESRDSIASAKVRNFTASRYEEMSAHMTADITFYVELARQADGPLVELAVGNGCWFSACNRSFSARRR